MVGWMLRTSGDSYTLILMRNLGLNERPIYRKTLSARPFLAVLEGVFQQKISRAQQDAHEFLQVVAETLAEEYHKQKRLEGGTTIGRMYPETTFQNANAGDDNEGDDNEGRVSAMDETARVKEQLFQEDGGMPLEGKLESEIECQKCHFKPKSTVSTFVVLTLPVPQKVCPIGIYQGNTWF